MIGYGLFGMPNPLVERRLDDSDWQTLFQLSQDEAVSALLFDAVLLLPKEQRPPKQVLFHFASMADTIERENRRRSQTLLQWTALIYRELSLPTIVVKGSSMASYYPCPLHRECGDNDLLTGNDTESICTLLGQKGLEMDYKDPRHVATKYQGIPFELHRFLLYHNDDPVWTPVPFDNPEGLPLKHLPIEQEAFFIAKHIEHHAVFFHKPLLLRSLVDWSMLVTHPDFDYASLNELKKDSDVDMFADLLTFYCSQLFGLQGLPSFPRLVAGGLDAETFRHIYIECPDRHRLAVVRVFRRSAKYLRYGRKYKALYGQSMFRRFYRHNVIEAIKAKMRDV